VFVGSLDDRWLGYCLEVGDFNQLVDFRQRLVASLENEVRRSRQARAARSGKQTPSTDGCSVSGWEKQSPPTAGYSTSGFDTSNCLMNEDAYRPNVELQIGTMDERWLRRSLDTGDLDTDHVDRITDFQLRFEDSIRDEVERTLDENIGYRGGSLNGLY
jgi:hypothetical protein